MQFKVLINRLLMPCGCSHFDARQRPEASECWCHLNLAVWLKCEMFSVIHQMAEILTLKSNYNPRQSREGSYDIRAFEFLLPTFESGFWFSLNGHLPVIWIISLYLWNQVYFSWLLLWNIPFLSITYFRVFFLRVTCPVKSGISSPACPRVILVWKPICKPVLPFEWFVFDNGIHFLLFLGVQDVQILMNKYCNDHMNFNDGTCCSSSEPVTTLQIITAGIFGVRYVDELFCLAFLILALWNTTLM